MIERRTVHTQHYPHTTNADPRDMPVSVSKEPWEPCPQDGCPYNASDECGLMACPGRAK